MTHAIAILALIVALLVWFVIQQWSGRDIGHGHDESKERLKNPGCGPCTACDAPVIPLRPKDDRRSDGTSCPPGAKA
ncbi:MAG: hypothetical protein ACQEXJ_24575 [Myxococcota bacterium]